MLVGAGETERKKKKTDSEDKDYGCGAMQAL